MSASFLNQLNKSIVDKVLMMVSRFYTILTKSLATFPLRIVKSYSLSCFLLSSLYVEGITVEDLSDFVALYREHCEVSDSTVVGIQHP